MSTLTPATPRQSAQLAALLDLLARGIVTGGDAAELLDSLVTLVGAEAGAIGTEIAWEGFVLNQEVPEDWQSAYVATRHFDPLAHALRSRPPGWMNAAKVFETGHAPDENPCVQEFSDRFADCIGARLPTTAGEDHWIALYRGRGGALFDAEDHSLLRALLPHLSIALRSRIAITALDAPADESCQHAVIRLKTTVMFSFDEERVQWSTAARSLLLKRLGRISDRGWRRLAECVRAAAHRYLEQAPAGDQMLLPHIAIDFARIPRATGTHHSMLGLLRPLESEQLRRGTVLPADCLLSPAEGRVARLLSDALTVGEIAATCGVSIGTIKTQQKSIYRKLGIASRAELISIYAR